MFSAPSCSHHAFVAEGTGSGGQARNSVAPPETESKGRHISRLKRKAFAGLHRTGVAFSYPRGACRRGAVHCAEAKEATKACGFAVEQLLANSPDFNPIENVWAGSDSPEGGGWLAAAGGT